MIVHFVSLEKKLKISLCFILFLNIILWFFLRHDQARWGNVPPAPEIKYASVSGLGDSSFAYRMHGLMIQGLGNSGGRFEPLKDYDFSHLETWFLLQDNLDPVSDFIPYLAAYYFGGVQETEKLRSVLPYLRMVGLRPEGEKWRWLAQAVYLARYRLKDYDLALEMAHELAALPREDLPGWTKQMPAFVKVDQGDKQAAYSIMIEILKSSAETLHPNEVNAMRDFICLRLLEKDEAQKNPLCSDIPLK